MVTSLQARLNLNKTNTPTDTVNKDQTVQTNASHNAKILAFSATSEQHKYEKAKQAITKAAQQLNW